jgi:hypothetical protein
MKKLYLLLILFTIILLASVTYVFSANTTLTIKGTDSVTTGSTGKLTIQLTSSDVIVGVMGVISKNSNITNIEIVGKNEWSVGAFNKETGSFNIIKNEGASNEEILEIQYTVSNSTGTGKIDIKDITVANIQDYGEEEVQAISKSISIVNQQEPDDPQPDNPQPDTPQPDTPSEQGSTANTNVVPNGTNTNSQKVDTKNTTSSTSKTILPKAGIGTIIIPCVVILICVLAGCMYFKYKKYKGIK